MLQVARSGLARIHGALISSWRNGYGWLLARLRPVAERPLPESEVRAFRDFLTSAAELFDVTAVAERYRRCGLTVVSDPYSAEVAERVRAALVERRSLSVVRIGDGEASLLTFGEYPGTPELDHWAVLKMVAKQKDRCPVVEPWPLRLRSIMREAVASADVIGVGGLWHARARTEGSARAAEIDGIMERFTATRTDARAVSGYWRGVHHLVGQAERGALDGKTIASAHLYVGIVKHVALLVPASARVLCVTDKLAAVDLLRAAFPDQRFDALPVGRGSDDGEAAGFLDRVAREMGDELEGVLCLVGAGIWGELYCTWAKQRGGVAVDIGSAFDLLIGQTTRHVHRHLDVDGFAAHLRRPQP